MNPSLEFRCFVKSRVLVGISQRDHLNHYTYLGELKDSLGYEIEEFFENYLQDSFPDDSFVFDVFVPEPYDRVFLIDINPWAPTTDPLLFTWYELLSITDEELRPDRYRNRVSSSLALLCPWTNPMTVILTSAFLFPFETMVAVPALLHAALGAIIALKASAACAY